MRTRRAAKPAIPAQPAMDLIVDQYCLFPGDIVTITLQAKAVNHQFVFLFVPDSFELLSKEEFVSNQPLSLPHYAATRNGVVMAWEQTGRSAQHVLTLSVQAQANPTEIAAPAQFVAFSSNAQHLADCSPYVDFAHHSLDPSQCAMYATTVDIKPKSTYLQYLPMIYETDPFMGRYLMIFERMWQPIVSRIDNISDYFNPKIMPESMLTYMATIFDLDFHEDWSVSRKRQVVEMGLRMHRRRGTRQNLQDILEIHSGGDVQIVERTARSMQLGKDATLGGGIALGHDNQPNTFQVTLWVPTPSDVSETHRHTYQQQLYEEMDQVIQLHIPAQASYKLTLNLVD